MARRIPIGPVFAVFFGGIWSLLMAPTMGWSWWVAFLAGVTSGLLYATFMTLWIAWRHTNGGRQPMQDPPLRDARSFVIDAGLTTIRERAATALAEMGVQPRWTDDADGFRVEGTTGLLHERVRVEARQTEAGIEVTVGSEPRWPWVVYDLGGRNEANVRRLGESLSPSAQPPRVGVGQRAAPRQPIAE